MMALVPIMPCAYCGEDRPVMITQLALPWFKVPHRYFCSMECFLREECLRSAS